MKCRLSVVGEVQYIDRYIIVSGSNNNNTSGGSGQPRSDLLEQFRQNNLQTLQLKDIQGHVFEFAQDQHGSRYVHIHLKLFSIPRRTGLFNQSWNARRWSKRMLSLTKSSCTCIG
jgi:hypothetical protein